MWRPHAVVLTSLALSLMSCQGDHGPGDCQCECVCRFDDRGTAASAPSPATAPAPIRAAPATPATPSTRTTPSVPADKIVIGHVGSMTGSEAAWGESTERGIRLAVDEQNRKGGVKSRQIVLTTLDDQGKPEEAAAAATRLVQQHVNVIIGEAASSRTLAMAPIADANQIPMISHFSTNPKVTKEGDITRPYVFRVCFIDPFQGTVMAKFARDVLKVYQVAVLRDTANEYSMGLATYFSSRFKELGGGIVIDQSYKTGDKDFRAQLVTIKGKHPEAIFVPGYYTDVALIARQAREIGLTKPFLGGDGWDSAKLYEIAKGALDGSYFSNHYSDQDPSPAIQDFVKKYKAAYNATPDATAVLGYDAVRLAFDAMERAPDLSGPSVRQALEATRGFQTVTGVITLDADHNALKSAVVLSIDKNAPYYAATITP
jgi:branched-chain amino acid transport system substrate-binding protein